MSRTILIRLAATLPKGSAGRRTLLTHLASDDTKGTGDFTVYFETDSPKVFHKWKFPTKAKAVAEAVKAQAEVGGYVTVTKKGIEVAEIGPGGQVSYP